MSTSIKTQARKDAHEYARSQMYYGDGAGTRRKLIGASVEHKIMTIPGYDRMFHEALAGQNMDEHAKKAMKERQRRDVADKIDRNVRGLAGGDRRSLTGDVAVLVAIYAALRATGLDEPIKAEVKSRYAKAKSWARVKRAEYKLRQEPKSDES